MISYFSNLFFSNWNILVLISVLNKSLLDLLILYLIILIILTIYKHKVTFYGIFFIFFIFFFVYIYIYTISFRFIVFESNTYELNINLIQNLNINFDFNIYLKVDSLSFLFSFLVILIGFSTNLYTLTYFKYEPFLESFLLLLNWFIFGMNILLFANNFFTLILGWELIGLFSFFLINFWNVKKYTLKSSYKAFCFNKLSDIFLLVFIVIIIKTFNTSNIHLINISIDLLYNSNNTYNTHKNLWNLKVAVSALIICASIKSAQIFFHIWLPDSMEAPVPASALIHSATLVSAGIYLLTRFEPLIYITETSNLLIFIGSLTAFYGGLVSATQTDIKRILAYSTISHCGFMYVCIGLHSHSLLIIYFYLHGIFKAGSFFCCGSFIYISNTQDIRQMGSLSNISYTNTILLIIFTTNLGGFPFTFGFLYKKLFFSIILISKISLINIIFLFGGMLCSIVYVYNIIFYVCFDFNKTYSKNMISKLQINFYKDKNYYSLSTFVQTISLIFLLCVSSIFYLCFEGIFINSNLIFESFPLYLKIDKSLILLSLQEYKIYYNLFYFSYILVWIYLTIINWRVSFTIITKFNFFLFIIQFNFFLLIWVNFISFI